MNTAIHLSPPHRRVPTSSSGARPVAATAGAPTVFRLSPPYRAAERNPRLDGVTAAHMPVGTILGLEVTSTAASVDLLLEAIGSLRRRFPANPVILWVNPGEGDVAALASAVASLPARAVLIGRELKAETLRRSMTRPIEIARDLVEWLPFAGIRVTPVVGDLLTQIFRHARAYSDVSTLLQEVGTAASTARFRCRKKRIPAPGRWFHAARALHCALRLQAQPLRPLLPIALELGYADHSSLSHQLQRTFSVSPGQVRRTLGWEWLMLRWLALEAPHLHLRGAEPRLDW
jgi:AraC-like DNA-binding protein